MDDVEDDDSESGSGGDDTDTENGWELLPEGDSSGGPGSGEHTSNFLDGRSLPEPVHIDDARTVLLVARGGAAGIGNSAMMRSKMSSEGGTAQKLQSMVRRRMLQLHLAAVLTLPVSLPVERSERSPRHTYPGSTGTTGRCCSS